MIFVRACWVVVANGGEVMFEMFWLKLELENAVMMSRH